MVPIVIYHSPCIDGFTAAWAIWKKHPDWEFFAGKHAAGFKIVGPLTVSKEIYGF